MTRFAAVAVAAVTFGGCGGMRATGPTGRLPRKPIRKWRPE